MNRRGFIQAILATSVAPFVVTTAGVLMPVKRIVTSPYEWIPGIAGNYFSTPDAAVEALDYQAWINGVEVPVFRQNGSTIIDYRPQPNELVNLRVVARDAEKELRMLASYEEPQTFIKVPVSYPVWSIAPLPIPCTS